MKHSMWWRSGQVGSRFLGLVFLLSTGCLSVGCSGEAETTAGPASGATGGDTIDGGDSAGQPDTEADAGGTPDAGCTPDCAGRTCGDDGCGGSCGACLNLRTGVSDDPALCVEGSCVPVSGALSVTVTYSGAAVLDFVQVTLFQGLTCAEAGARSTNDASFSVSGTLGEAIEISPIERGTAWAVVALASGPGGVERRGCVAEVVIAGTDPAVTVPLQDPPPEVVVHGSWVLNSQLDFGESLPPSVEGLVTNLDEMTDDHDIFNDDPNNGQYGQDPAAFVLDFVYRQFCCWEAVGPDADFDSCKDQAVTHPAGDLSAIYLQDFTSWPGAQPLTTGLCGALSAGVDPLLQAIVMEVLDATAPNLTEFLDRVPKDLANAVRNMRIRSELVLTEQGEVTNFSHRLVSMSADLHDYDGMVHNFEIDLAAAGVSTPTQTGIASVNAVTVSLPEHTFPLDVGKVVQYVYAEGLLPLLGFESSLAMVSSWVDCTSLGETLEEEIPDLGFLDADDYTKFCGDGLEEAADFLDDQVAEIIEAKIQLTLAGTAQTGEVARDGQVQTLSQGIWAGKWTENDASGDFPGTFDGHRGSIAGN